MSQKTAQNYFYQNFVKFPSAVKIFGTKMAKTIRAILYVTHRTFAHFREEPQILGYHLEITLNVFK